LSVAPRGQRPAGAAPRPSTRVRCVLIFLDKNRRYIGKSQSKRPPIRTQRAPHQLADRRPRLPCRRLPARGHQDVGRHHVGLLRAQRAGPDLDLELGTARQRQGVQTPRQARARCRRRPPKHQLVAAPQVAGIHTPGPASVSIFLDKNIRFRGKSQSKRPPRRTQRRHPWRGCSVSRGRLYRCPRKWLRS
jgi:hypothetical protein